MLTRTVFHALTVLPFSMNSVSVTSDIIGMSQILEESLTSNMASSCVYITVNLFPLAFRCL